MAYKMSGWSGYQNSPLNKKEKFKPHVMYGEAGESKTANTYEEHLNLQKKGWGHTKPKKTK